MAKEVLAGATVRRQLFEALLLPRPGDCDTAVSKRTCAWAFLVPRQAIARVVVLSNGILPGYQSK